MAPYEQSREDKKVKQSKAVQMQAQDSAQRKRSNNLLPLVVMMSLL